MTTARIKFKFSIFAFFIGYYMGSEVTVGSEDPHQNFLKGIFVQEGSSGTCFDHGRFEIKTFTIYAPLYWICNLHQNNWSVSISKS